LKDNVTLLSHHTSRKNRKNRINLKCKNLLEIPGFEEYRNFTRKTNFQNGVKKAIS